MAIEDNGDEITPPSEFTADELQQAGQHWGGTASSAELLAIRGAYGSVRLPQFARGPRPGQDDNVLEPRRYVGCTDEERGAMRRAYEQRFYHTWPLGAYENADPQRRYGTIDLRTDPDAVLAAILELQADGFIPLFAAWPQGFGVDDMAALEEIYQSPEWQGALTLVLPAGFGSADHARIEWGAKIFPDAIRLVDVHATAAGRVFDVADLLHGWLVGSDHFGHVVSGATPGRATFAALFDPTQDESLMAMAHTQPSAFGATTRMRLFAGRYAAYWCIEHNRPEAEAQAWGDAAMGAGADGYLDGGTMPVPVV